MSDYTLERVRSYRLRMMREMRVELTEAAVVRKLIELGLEQGEAKS